MLNIFVNLQILPTHFRAFLAGSACPVVKRKNTSMTMSLCQDDRLKV